MILKIREDIWKDLSLFIKLEKMELEQGSPRLPN